MCHQAERAERDAIRKEEAETRERHRRNFDKMVATAKEKAAGEPPAPHDPMRFRAVPPGESDSDDDSDLPPSCRISRKGLGLKTRPGGAAAVPVPVPTYSQVDEESGEAEDDDKALPPLQQAQDLRTAAPDGIDEAAGSEALMDNADSGSDSADSFVMVPRHEPGVLPEEPTEATADETMESSVIVTGMADSRHASNNMVATRQILMQEVRNRRAPKKSPIPDGTGSAVLQARKFAEQQRGPTLWGTGKYRRLWEMACEVGEQQEQQANNTETPGEYERLGNEDEQQRSEWVDVDGVVLDVAFRPSSTHPGQDNERRLDKEGDGEPPSQYSPDDSGSDSSGSSFSGRDNGVSEDDDELFERYCVTSIAGHPQLGIVEGPPLPAELSVEATEVASRGELRGLEPEALVPSKTYAGVEPKTERLGELFADSRAVKAEISTAEPTGGMPALSGEKIADTLHEDTTSFLDELD